MRSSIGGDWRTPSTWARQLPAGGLRANTTRLLSAVWLAAVEIEQATFPLSQAINMQVRLLQVNSISPSVLHRPQLPEAPIPSHLAERRNIMPSKSRRDPRRTPPSVSYFRSQAFTALNRPAADELSGRHLPPPVRTSHPSLFPPPLLASSSSQCCSAPSEKIEVPP